MLHLSRLSIEFKKSNLYLRLALLIHSFALLVVYLSGCWLWIKLLFALILVRQWLAIKRWPCPTAEYSQLDFSMNTWSLTDRTGNRFHYDKHRVILNAGLFFLLELREEQQRKLLVIFFDQLEKEDFRRLKLIEKIG